MGFIVHEISLPNSNVLVGAISKKRYQDFKLRNTEFLSIFYLISSRGMSFMHSVPFWNASYFFYLIFSIFENFLTLSNRTTQSLICRSPSLVVGRLYSMNKLKLKHYRSYQEQECFVQEHFRDDITR